MAPEQHDSPETVDHRADIFSLGVVFYELLTGELPRGGFPPPCANTPVSTKIETVTLIQKENETMIHHEEHFEQPQQAANEQRPFPKWNEVGTVEKSGSGGRIWKYPLWFFSGAIIALFGAIVLRNVLDVAAQNPPPLVFGTGIMIAPIIVAGIVLIVCLIVKNTGTSVPNIPHVDQSTLFCTHCGNRLTGGVYACPHCGFAPRSERNFCFHCGVATNPKQVMCIACGFPLQVPLSSHVSGFLKARKDKVAAAVLAILLGWLGIHKFYLGSWGWGVLYILFSLTGIPFILGIIEGVIYLVMDEVAFDVKYNQTLASPFRW